MSRRLIAVHISSGRTERRYSLRRVPVCLHGLAIDLLKWRVAVAEVTRRRRGEREALCADWDSR